MHIPTLHETFAYLFDIGLDLLASTLDPSTGTPTAQLGDVTKDRADSDRAEMWFGAPGLCARPALPNQGAASCQAIAIKRSDHDLCIAYRDLRANQIFGNLAPGEGCFYATTGQARQLVKADGSVRSLTTDSNVATGNTIWCGISPYYQGLDGQPHLGGEWRYYAPWGGAWHDPSGYHLRTHHGVKIDAGGLTFPAPISATASTYALKADVVTIRCQSTTIGTATAAQPVVLAVALQTQLALLEAAINVYTQAVSTFAGAIGVSVPALAPAAATVEGASSTLAGTMATIIGSLALTTGAKSTAAS